MQKWPVSPEEPVSFHESDLIAGVAGIFLCCF